MKTNFFGKKAQITIFIIIGIVLLFGSAAFFYIQKSINGEKLGVTTSLTTEKPTYIKGSEESQIKTYVETCMKNVAVPGIYELARNGGFIYYFNHTLITEYEDIAYHYEYGNDVSPSIEFMQNELNKFIENSIPFCINNFENLHFEIETGKFNSSTQFTNNEIILNAKYPVTIIKEGSRKTIESYSITIPIRLLYIINNKNIILKNLNQSDYLDLENLTSYDFDINILPHDLESLIYSIHDSKSDIKGNPFIFNFAIKELNNLPPELDFIPNFVLSKNKSFVYNVMAFDYEEDKLFFYTNLSIIKINSSNGLINFTPLQSKNYSFDICVKDNNSQSDCQIVKFMVQDE